MKRFYNSEIDIALNIIQLAISDFKWLESLNKDNNLQASIKGLQYVEKMMQNAEEDI